MPEYPVPILFIDLMRPLETLFDAVIFLRWKCKKPTEVGFNQVGSITELYHMLLVAY